MKTTTSERTITVGEACEMVEEFHARLLENLQVVLPARPPGAIEPAFVDFGRLVADTVRRADIVIWTPESWRCATGDAESRFGLLDMTEQDVPLRPEVWITPGFVRSELATPGPGQFRRITYSTSAVALVPLALVQDMLTLTVRDAIARSSYLASYNMTAGDNGFAVIRRAHPIREGDGISWGVLSQPRTSYGLLRTGWPVSEPEAYLLAGRHFMASPLVDVTDQPIPAHEARRLRHSMGREPNLRVVTLRRLPHEKGYGGKIDFNCQFWVSAHWRRPNPRMHEQRPILVKAHLKGDPDKPLRPPRRIIFEVNK